MSDETTAHVPAPATPPAAVTPEHISALHRHLDEIGHALKAGFEDVIAFVRKNAPAVEAGAAAVASVVPGLGPVASVVETIAGDAASVASQLVEGHVVGKCGDPRCPCAKPAA